MKLNTMQPSSPTIQPGVALITGLIFLVVLTLISFSAIKSSSLEERMAGNARDQNLAFQAAEAAMREAKAYSQTLSPASAFVAGCAAGLCLNDPVTPVWTRLTTNSEWISAKTRQYSVTLPGVATQPRYIIELIPNSVPASGNSMKTGGSLSATQVVTYRFTARGWGVTNQSTVTLQGTF